MHKTENDQLKVKNALLSRTLRWVRAYMMVTGTFPDDLPDKIDRALEEAGCDKVAKDARIGDAVRGLLTDIEEGYHEDISAEELLARLREFVRWAQADSMCAVPSSLSSLSEDGTEALVKRLARLAFFAFLTFNEVQQELREKNPDAWLSMAEEEWEALRKQDGVTWPEAMAREVLNDLRWFEKQPLSAHSMAVQAALLMAQDSLSPKAVDRACGRCRICGRTTPSSMIHYCRACTSRAIDLALSGKSDDKVVVDKSKFEGLLQVANTVQVLMEARVACAKDPGDNHEFLRKVVAMKEIEETLERIGLRKNPEVIEAGGKV